MVAEYGVRPASRWVPRGGTDDDNPWALVFECADAPMPAAMMFDQPPGSLISMRTLGHVVDRGVLASIEFAVVEFGVPLIVVVGHRGCRALRTVATEMDTVTRFGGHMRCTVEQIGFELSVSGESDPDVAHVDAVCQRLHQRSPFLAQRVKDGSCAVAGAVCASDGRVSLHCVIGDIGEMTFGLIA